MSGLPGCGTVDGRCALEFAPLDLCANDHQNGYFMNSLILLLDDDPQWSLEKWAINEGGVASVDGRILIESGVNWLFVQKNMEVLLDYDDEEIILVRCHLSTPLPFLIEWRGGEMLTRLLLAIPYQIAALVDNDHGLIFPVKCVAELNPATWVNRNQ